MTLLSFVLGIVVSTILQTAAAVTTTTTTTDITATDTTTITTDAITAPTIEGRHLLRSSSSSPRRNSIDVDGPPPAILQDKHDEDTTATIEHIFDVLIIGAGWAGVSAGYHLLREWNIANFEIIEAREYAGGRSRTIYPFQNVGAPNLAVEIGSAWTYEDTEVHDIVLELNKQKKMNYGQIHYKDTPPSLYDTNGIVDIETKKSLMKLWDDYCEYSKKKSKKLLKQKQDVPYEDIFQEYLVKKETLENRKLTNYEIQYLKTMIHAQIEIEWATRTDNLSTVKVGKSVNECIFCDADYYIPVEGGGFDKVLSPLVTPLLEANKLIFNSVVTEIEYDMDAGDGATIGKVAYFDKTTQKTHTKYAKTILTTIPLGVLKKKAVRFNPPLPQSKLDAIDVIGFGILNKCILYWDKNTIDELSFSSWWPEGHEVLEFINTNNNNNDGNGDTNGNGGGDLSFTTFFNEKQLGNGGHYVLSAWIGGQEAIDMESQTDDQIVNVVMKNLRIMLGDSIPPPTSHVISRWGSDEYAYGSYSYSTVINVDGSDGKEYMSMARRELGQRTGTNLFWAGEATNKSWSGTTVGAYRSGIDAINDIIFTLRKHTSSTATTDTTSATTSKTETIASS